MISRKGIFERSFEIRFAAQADRGAAATSCLKGTVGSDVSLIKAFSERTNRVQQTLAERVRIFDDL
jgi:fumarylacetoacetate (FAA) hydrolase family protein